MRHYELLVIFPGSISETDVPKSEQKFRDLCIGAGVSITREEPTGKRKLAYAIAGEQYGYYQSIECDAAPAMINELEKKIRLSPEILRHALYQKPVKSQAVRERETKLRERVAQSRATKVAEEQRLAAESALPKEGKGVPIDIAALDKKLEELLITPEV